MTHIQQAGENQGPVEGRETQMILPHLPVRMTPVKNLRSQKTVEKTEKRTGESQGRVPEGNQEREREAEEEVTAMTVAMTPLMRRKITGPAAGQLRGQ